MKLLNPRAERRALVSICGSPKKVAGSVLANINEDFFYYEPCVEAFKRILKLARNTGHIPDYTDLCADPTLSEDVRKSLSRNKENPVRNKVKARRLVKTLDEYRKMRGLYFMAEENLKALQETKVDPDKLLSETNERLTRLRTNSQRENAILNIGKGSNVSGLIKDILYGERDQLIPTGFKAFDDENGGIPLTALFTIASNSGGGKSAMAQQLMLNMTRRGYDVALVPLEMSERDTMYRVLANIAETPVNKLSRRSLTKSEKKHVQKEFRKYNKELKKSKTKYSMYVPEEDMTIEEILFLLRPYKYNVIIIDYISLLKGSSEGVNDWQELGAIARAAKVYAKANNTAVILLAQLSDEGKVKYSQKIKEDSDMCWVWTYTDETRETGILDIRQLKARNMNPFPFQLSHDYEIMRIADVDDPVLQKMRSKKGDQKRKELDEFVREVGIEEDDEDQDEASSKRRRSRSKSESRSSNRPRSKSKKKKRNRDA